MSLLPVLFLLTLVGFLCQVQCQVASATDEDVDRCYNNLVQKLRILNGGFITQAQGVQMTGICFDMYLVKNKTLQEITDYMRDNVNNFGFTPDQINIMTDVYNNIAQILGSEDMANQIFKKSLNLAFEFISNDKSQVDQKIAELRSQGASLNTIKQQMCQMMYTLTTIEKKKALTAQISAIIPQDSLDAVKQQLTKIMRI